MGHHLSPFVHEKMIQLIKDGLPGGVICSRLGVSMAQLRMEAKKQGLKIKRDVWESVKARGKR